MVAIRGKLEIELPELPENDRNRQLTRNLSYHWRRKTIWSTVNDKQNGQFKLEGYFHSLAVDCLFN